MDEDKAKLIITVAGKPDIVVELPQMLTIGRSTANQLVLDDQRASRKHAEIRRVDEAQYCLLDLGSSNGTWLNGRRITGRYDLMDGDQIVIGDVRLRFIAPPAPARNDASMASGTALFMQSENVIVLVADIRDYTSMSEALPGSEVSRVISDWFREASEIIEQNHGMVDKFIGDAIMAFWVVAERSRPERETAAALNASQALIDRAESFSKDFCKQFPGYSFRIGIGLNMGEAMLGNVGTGKFQSFTVVGDSVNVAFRLESLSKELNASIIVGSSITGYARGSEYSFRDLGAVEVKGKVEPVQAYALEKR